MEAEALSTGFLGSSTTAGALQQVVLRRTVELTPRKRTLINDFRM